MNLDPALLNFIRKTFEWAAGLVLLVVILIVLWGVLAEIEARRSRRYLKVRKPELWK